MNDLELKCIKTQVDYAGFMCSVSLDVNNISSSFFILCQSLYQLQILSAVILYFLWDNWWNCWIVLGWDSERHWKPSWNLFLNNNLYYQLPPYICIICAILLLNSASFSITIPCGIVKCFIEVMSTQLVLIIRLVNLSDNGIRFALDLFLWSPVDSY